MPQGRTVGKHERHSGARQGRIHPKRSLGQNFLRDDNIARKIVAAIRPSADDVIVEIGPGEGALTRFLKSTVSRLVLIDIDPRVTERMRAEYAGENVDVIQGDVLEIDLTTLAGRFGSRERRLRVVGNIPYNITSPIVLHVLEHRASVSNCILMMQKEVAQRLAARHGSKVYGILSVFSQLAADVRVLFDVPPSVFVPRPRVMSSVVSLTMLPGLRYPLRDEAFFRTMVRGVFGKRRKTLRNGLRYVPGIKEIGLPAWVDGNRRPEDFSVEELVHLANDLVTASAGPV